MMNSAYGLGLREALGVCRTSKSFYWRQKVEAFNDGSVSLTRRKLEATRDTCNTRSTGVNGAKGALP